MTNRDDGEAVACDFAEPCAGYATLTRQLAEAQAKWYPIETKPSFTHVEEKGEYKTDDGQLWYFKPTHWKPINQK